jgi:hypothetical protein
MHPARFRTVTGTSRPLTTSTTQTTHPTEKERIKATGSWSLLSHGVAERKRLDLDNLNPIYERVLTKLDGSQMVAGVYWLT